MEVDEVPRSDSLFQTGEGGSGSCLGDASVLHDGERVGADGGELLQCLSQEKNSKKQRTFRRVKRVNHEKVKEEGPSLDKKRSWVEEVEVAGGGKRQRFEMMWRDEVGDVVEVEMVISPEQAGLLGQPRPTK